MADFLIRGGGTIYEVIPQNDAAETHLGEICPRASEHLYRGKTLMVEHGYIERFIDALREDGFSVDQ